MFDLSCQDARTGFGRGESTGTSAGPEGALCDTRQDTRTLRARTFFLCSADTSGRHEASAYGTDNDAWDPHWFAWEDWRRSWGTIGASDPPVPHSAAAGFVTPEDGGISWDRPAEEIHNLIRAFARPFSGAFGLLGDEMVFFLRSAAVADCSMEPGVPGFREGTILIGTGRGSLEPREIEVNGRVLTGPQLLAFFKEHGTDTFL